MLAIKECLIREGVLNLTSTSNLGNGALGDEENRVGGVGAAVAGAAATANSNNIYGNRFSDAAAVSNNLRAISANYTYNNDNRYKRYNDKMTATTAATTNTTTLALEPQLAKLRDQKSVDTTHSPNTNYENKSSNCSLSSASVTAKSSCQQTSSVYDKIKHQQQQQQQLQQQQQRQQTSKHHSKEQQQQPGTRSSSSSSTRYHGVHPHFHHHTAPAYYTDVNLHIHTPKANDVTSLNENYQSVYNTPTQLVKEHYFPKTSTATVVPPPIGTGAAVIGRASTTSPSSLEKRERERERNKVPIDSASSNNKSANTAAARAAFFRGGSAGSSGYNNGERPSHEALAKSSPAFGRPTETGELNDTTYTPYVDSGSSFVVVDINSSSDCSKYNNNNNVKPLDDNSATDITQHDSINHNYNNSNIKSITSPTSPTGTNTSTTTTSAGRSRNSHRFAGKRRAVRVRSESRPISALYDIICKEKGLDIGTSTTNEEDSSAPSNDDDAHHSARNSHNTKGKSKERSHPRSSSSRNNSLKNSKDYAEISNCLTAFVANSLSNYLGGTAYDQSNMDHAATASGDTNATHDRAKRSHKARASSGHKPGSKKRKDVGGKTKASTPRSPRDEELNGETSEDSNDAFAHTPLSARSKHRADCNRRMNGTEKAASLPPQLHVTAQHATTTTGTGMPQKATTHTNNVESNTHLNVRKKCSIHCRCQLGCECRSANSAHRTTHYPYEYHQSSLPPNLSSGTCSSVRSPSTADDESLGYSPEKLYIEPVNMNLSGISSSPANAKHANSSSSGVVLEPTSSIHSVRNTKERVSRAQQRRLREEMRRHTDLPQLDSLSPSSLSNISQVVGAAEKALSEDEGVAGVKQQDNRTSRARRFINRPSRTPSRGRSANSAHSSPHSARRINTQHADNSTSSSSPPAESTHSRHLTAAAAGDDYSLSNLALPPVSPNASTVTIEDVGSTSSSDHIAHIQLSPLQIMTNSATPATELRPPANGSAALDVGEAHPADTEVNAEAGTANFGVQVAISDDSLAARRRRRRELGMVRQLVPPDDPVLREMLSPRQNKTDTSAKNLASHKPPHNELAYHMEIARRGWDLVNPSVSNRARSETASPKYELHARESLIRERPSSNRLARRSDTLHLGELRKLRSNDVNRKVNERTKTDLAEIKKIAEQANVEMAMMASGIAADLAAQAVRGGEDYISNDLDGRDSNECIVELATPARYGIGSRQQALTPPPAPSYTELEVAAEAKERDPSPAKHATFVQEERIYYEPEADELVAKSISNTTMSGGILRQRILKARSMERDAGHEPPKLSPILRRRSTDDPTYIPVPTGAAGVYSTSPSTSTHNHIVSILKKKDHIAGESSSASSNASPVTFSANVVDTPTSKQKRAGILKKRSSLDESRYYSRSHSPDERSILIKSARRNSLEETAGLQQQQQHGILKQSSYESSKSDGCPSATEPHPHGILKKKDSTSTPSDGGTHAPKHVSISQAVKMAAAELGRETADNQAIAGGEHDESGYTPSNEEYEIRPILKLESISSDDAMRPPKPILKKKSSGDSDEYEIRPILKTSRKSSREEFDLGGAISEDGRHYSEPPPPIVRPILKTDSPSKRRSLGGEELEPDVFSAEQVSGQSPSLLKRRTRSLERQEVPVVDLAAALNAIATSQAAPLEFVSTPITTGGSISVAERIKNMEMFLSSNGTSPSTPVDANTSWESPLQSGVTPKLFKPSAIRRDMYRDRYKTQPITNDEKLHFKATASPLDTSTTSAFKPTKSLDAGLNYNTFAHLNAPTAASSVSPGSSYTLTRCATQPLHSQHHFKAAETSSSSGTPPPPLPTLRATIGRHNSLSDSYSNANNNNHNNSISEQLNLSAGSDSERIFEMSGIEEAPIESAGKVEGGADAAGAGAGLTRKNSVRARANMFQQLQQEKTRSAEATSALAGTALGREERTSPRRGSSQLSPTTSMLPTIAPIMSSSISSTSGLHTNSHEEPKTPQNPIRTDEEIEPTSLPVSERLRFFTNLTEAASRSASSSYTRSPSQRFLTATDRCGSANSFSHNNSFTFTSRSSYNGDSTSTSSASASVTPTPMECCSPPLTEQQQLISINEIDSPLQLDSARHSPSPPPSIGLPNVTQQASSTYIHLTKSSSQTLLPSVLAQRLAMSAPAPTATAAALTTSPSSLTPVARRIKMKTIGKLLLPNTFLNNERNSLQNFSSNTSENGVSVNSAQSDTCESESGSYIEADNKAPPAPLKKIGKIKSPFIENCLQMQQKHHQLNSKCMKYDHKSTPHNALAALENNGSNGNGGGGGGERDINSLPPRKPLQNGNAGLPPPPRIETTEDSKADSGKENNYCDTNAAPLLTLSPTASSIALSEQLSQSPVVEMRKKFTRIMSSATLSTVAQRHTAHALSNGNGNNNGNAQANGNSASSAPTTPRNSIIDDKFAKYFGLTTGGNQPAAATATTNKATNGNQRTARAQESLNTATARSVGASETSLSSRSATNYPPLPPPDFAGTPNGDLHASVKKLTDALSFAKEINTSSATPHEAFNHNVRSNSNTPYFTPPSVCAYDITLTQTSSATGTASAGGSASTGVSASAVQRRRDMSKRQRANTTNITFTPTSSNTQLFSAQANADTPSSGRTRALRSRALTLTHGVPLPEVKRFEDIVVTKEEFQLASKEFERIFLGVI
ncbi:serine/arginine repetitive matrix protein 2-like isoform X9 [Bactrocera tryoni]|uniref:serine/arginine repetitive matrix protein 2-like isoform X9 n=1 Tax=Bactrocera tryoni TaxID=59916 RepID=UPI001A99DCED|nr:serine/arginine repetitive matrix protein 2-like isoform X9 [Bactrocera tryoni]